MKITILGSGSAYGTPMILNRWDGSNAADPCNRRLRASVFLEDADKNLLVDAGPDLREQINRENINDFNAVFITHAHYDHIGGIPELPRACKLLGHKIDVYASAATLEEIRQCYAYLFSGTGEPDSSSLNWHVLTDPTSTVWNWMFSPFPTTICKAAVFVTKTLPTLPTGRICPPPRPKKSMEPNSCWPNAITACRR